MRVGRTATAMIFSALASIACACSSDAPKGAFPAQDAGAAASGRGAASSGGAATLATASDAGALPLPSCVTQAIAGDPVPVDMYIMLDRSGSMLEVTGTGETKWDAIRTALTSFVNDDRSAGLGVGLQYFPLATDGVPESCSTDSECGPGGPCLTRACLPPSIGSIPFTLCLADGDCPSLSPGCAPFGVCELDSTFACFDLGAGGCAAMGACNPTPSECVHYASCDVVRYADPAVPIQTLPGSAKAFVDSLVAEVPLGLTPTSAALAGALSQAHDHAVANPVHRVIAVLATDGTPTECTPLDVAGIASIASDGLAQTPSVGTYVIGVFGPSDTGALANLEQWAQAGGTEHAFVVDPAADVSAQFLDALETIRGGSLACEFLLPPSPAGSELDLTYVNVAAVEPGRTRDLRYVGDASRCGKSPLAWYYDDDPLQGHPTKIVVCRATCDTLHQVTDTHVEIRLGCKTMGPD